MPHRQLSLLTFAIAITYVSGVFIPKVEGQVLGASTSSEFPTKIETVTAFDQKEDIVVESIPFETEYKDDDEVEYGTEEVLEPGVEGTKTLTYLVIFWGDEEIDRQLTDTKVEDPKAEIISKGTKIVWRELNTSDVGGAIDGTDVDLGYVDASQGAWRTGYTTIYLISNAPDGSSKY